MDYRFVDAPANGRKRSLKPKRLLGKPINWVRLIGTDSGCFAVLARRILTCSELPRRRPKTGAALLRRKRAQAVVAEMVVRLPRSEAISAFRRLGFSTSARPIGRPTVCVSAIGASMQTTTTGTWPCTERDCAAAHLCVVEGRVEQYVEATIGPASWPP